MITERPASKIVPFPEKTYMALDIDGLPARFPWRWHGGYLDDMIRQEHLYLGYEKPTLRLLTASGDGAA